MAVAEVDNIMGYLYDVIGVYPVAAATAGGLYVTSI